MKNLSALLIISLFVLTTISCTTSNPETSPIANNNPNSGDLRLFVIDTSKVNTVTMTGTNETTILNRKVNSNSYIGSLSINGDATKFVYVDNQGATTNGNYVGVKTIRIANTNGSGDANIYTAPANTNQISTDIGFVKFGTSKIYFNTTVQTFSGGIVNSVIKLNSMNFDGTGLVALTGIGAGNDLTSDGRFLIEKNTATTSPYATKILIYDRTGDNGAGSLYNLETIPASATCSSPVFSFDDKFAYYAFSENQSLKVKIFNMTSKTWETKTIASGFTPTSFFISISVGSDNNRGVVVVSTFDNTPSKSYVFNLSNSSSTTFNNNDKNIDYLKAF